LARAVQSLKARCHRQSGPLSALGTAPALELVVELPVVLAPMAGPGLSHPPSPTWAGLAAQADGATGTRRPWSRAANPAGSPWAAISQWRDARRRPSSRLTTAIGLAPVLADGWAVPLAGSGSRPLGVKAKAGAAGAVGKRGGAAAWSSPPGSALGRAVLRNSGRTGFPLTKAWPPLKQPSDAS
jgi:hypothetical protein